MANERDDQTTPDIALMRTFCELQAQIPRHVAIAAAQWMLQRATDARVPWWGDDGQSMTEAWDKSSMIVVSIRRRH